MSGRGKKYIGLLEEKQIERWYKDLARGSQITADVHLRRLGFFSDLVNVKPMELIALKEEDISNLISDFIGAQEELGRAGNYIDAIITPIKGWLRFNGKQLIRKVKIKNAGINTKYGNEQIPSQDQLKKIFTASDTRSKVACALMSFSGFRPEVLGNYMGNDGLKIRDFPELHINNIERSVIFDNEITIIKVRPELSKTKKPYVSFLGTEGVGYLQSYLLKRMVEGENLTQDTPVIVPSKLGLRNKHISTINIGDIIRKSIRAAGLMNRPYILRSYFDTQLMIAESKGLIMHDYRVFMMGHSGSMEHKYTLDKMLTSDTIEDMRQSYGKCLKFLETENKGIPESEYNNQITEFKAMLLKLAGYMDEEIEKGDILNLDNAEIVKKIDEKKDKQINNGNSQKVVSIKEVKDYINKGWEYVNTLPGNKEAIIRIPS
jgi:integrase